MKVRAVHDLRFSLMYHRDNNTVYTLQNVIYIRWVLFFVSLSMEAQ